jgi:hypothetical protein
MRRNSYLGGSTVVHPGSGWFSRQARRKETPERKAVRELQAERALLESERRSQSLKKAIIDAAHDGSGSKIKLDEVLEVGRFSSEIYAVRIRSREQRHSAFEATKVRFDAKYSGSLCHFSLWTIEDAQGRRTTAVCHIDGKGTKLVGFEPDEKSFKLAAASSGWFAGSFEELDELPVGELHKIWCAGHSPKSHAIWSKLR